MTIAPYIQRMGRIARKLPSHSFSTIDVIYLPVKREVHAVEIVYQWGFNCGGKVRDESFHVPICEIGDTLGLDGVE